MQTDSQEAAEFRAGLEKLTREVRTKLKGESKRELLRIISALVVDNFMLKTQIEQLLEQKNQAVESSEPEQTNA